MLQVFDNREMSKADDREISILPSNSENFETVDFGRFKILDSCAFLQNSLTNLIDILDEKDRVLIASIPQTEEQAVLIKGKGQFPYDYFSSLEVMNETSLPPRAAFASILQQNTEGLTEEEYAKCEKIWTAFGMNTFKDWHDLYLKLDVYGLADVFEAFRRLCLSAYGLDPVHFVGLPSFGFGAMLKTSLIDTKKLDIDGNKIYSKVVLDQLTDVDMYQCFEKILVVINRLCPTGTPRQAIPWYLDMTRRHPRRASLCRRQSSLRRCNVKESSMSRLPLGDWK